MEYRLLGRTGLKVSELCLGAMTFGWTTTERDSLRIMDRFVEAGDSFIDTADVYSNGLSEQIVGTWFTGKPRDQLVGPGSPCRSPPRARWSTCRTISERPGGR
jgi:aryl-alcohol dehydrogenase-like predicted oxidoreductase